MRKTNVAARFLIIEVKKPVDWQGEANALMGVIYIIHVLAD